MVAIWASDVVVQPWAGHQINAIFTLWSLMEGVATGVGACWIMFRWFGVMQTGVRPTSVCSCCQAASLCSGLSRRRQVWQQ